MSESAADIWVPGRSVLFTSFWAWTPETWGCVGWSNETGRGRRTNLLKELTNPFITACYVTSNHTYADAALQGKIAGFLLVSHQTGDRDEFTHPGWHGFKPAKWRHSLRAVRAFSYLPEHRPPADALDPNISKRARTVAAMGVILTDPRQIALLRDTPWVEVDVYAPAAERRSFDDEVSSRGHVRPGPASRDGYVVSEGTLALKRQLYVLRLSGDTNAYLGRSAGDRSIYKIGLSFSPDTRRQGLQKSMPRGAFEWCVHRTSAQPGVENPSFVAAVAGEEAMKRHLARCAEWLGGEFYLATTEQIDEAWRAGLAGVQDHGQRMCNG